jgi:anti-sigma factor RsiW
VASQHWTGKLDAYLDGELSAADEQSVREHLRECPTCAADALDRMQMKRAVQTAGMRFKADPAFRARVKGSIGGNKSRARNWSWAPALAAAAIALVAVILWTNHFREHMRDRQLVSELVDQHVAALASSNPVDVVSSDRHTVKPWFEGKVPFTFDLPELQGTPFTLVGGRASYVNQSSTAELIFRLRQHQLSVFIFQPSERSGQCSSVSIAAYSFHVRSWNRDGLCYFAVGDVSGDDLNQLATLMKAPAS